MHRLKGKEITDFRAKLKTLYESGMSTLKLAKKFGYDSQTIFYHLHKAQTKMRAIGTNDGHGRTKKYLASPACPVEGCTRRIAKEGVVLCFKHRNYALPRTVKPTEPAEKSDGRVYGRNYAELCRDYNVKKDKDYDWI